MDTDQEVEIPGITVPEKTQCGMTESVIDYSRQSGLINQAQMTEPIILIGAGGIGSPTAQILCKMGIRKLTVYDDDKVEAHNLPNQMYRIKDLTKFKVDALKEICEEYSDTIEFNAKAIRFDQPIRTKSVVISGVDSMESRLAIWKHIKLNPAVSLYVDARMAREMIKIYRVNPTDMKSVKKYEESLHSDVVAVEVPCTEKSVIFNVSQVAAQICFLIKTYFVEAPFNYSEYFYDFTSGAQLYDSNM